MVPNGVDCAHNQPGLAVKQKGRLVFNGSLTYSANYEAMSWFLAQVYPKIRQQIPDVTLQITGATHGVDLSRLALDQSVTLTGYVEDVRLPVAQAEVCVVPIQRGGGTRLKVLEAMALGTPVVATAKGAEGLEVVDGMQLLVADSAIEFAQKTGRLLRDVEEQARLSQEARKLVERHYDWEMIGAQFRSLVERVVEDADHRLH
jgi:glycosyltransferase involved in cell wall biosynthesis